MSEHNTPGPPAKRWEVYSYKANRPGAEVTLNAPFVQEIGHEKAEELVAVINDIGSRLGHHPRAEILTALLEGYASVGLSAPRIELERMADEISRFDQTEAELGPEGQY